MAKNKSERAGRFKRYMLQSNWITDGWSWFMVLAGKAAEPVLILSVLYSSAKLLPALQPHLTPQLDAVVFIAQFIALDVGGLSLNKMADQVQDTNPKGARHAKMLSIALVVIMIVGVILASLSPIMAKIPQASNVIDTMLLIARAVLAVLYSRVIHSLKGDSEQPGPGATAPVPTVDIPAMIDQALAEQAARFESRLTDLVTSLKVEQAARFEGRLTDLATNLKAEQARLFANLQRVLITPDNGTSASGTKQSGTATDGTPASGTSTNGTHTSGTKQSGTATSETTSRSVPTGQLPAGRSNVLLLSERKHQAPATSSERTPAEIATDKVVWPLLDAGKTVRAIAEETSITRSAVGRSRVRWATANGTVANETSGLSQDDDAGNGTVTAGTTNLSQEQAG